MSFATLKLFTFLAISATALALPAKSAGTWGISFDFALDVTVIAPNGTGMSLSYRGEEGKMKKGPTNDFDPAKNETFLFQTFEEDGRTVKVDASCVIQGKSKGDNIRWNLLPDEPYLDGTRSDDARLTCESEGQVIVDSVGLFLSYLSYCAVPSSRYQKNYHEGCAVPDLVLF
uniref:AA1-like domain-containing protein n=1 Tax=Kwoniella bestiolae CBS 10118 TaxID=1296100 RepID=A0A1B9FYY1_9TREE|nr:hypothetical protein I302_06969 [Kwoniella bestiolae CBS 10118]OCF23983.1 hypothetical protein I302_06969 [Kwoniella bestiolae CBS 10118]